MTSAAGGPGPDGGQDGAQEAATRQLLWELALDAGGVGTFDWDLVTGRLVWDARLMTLFGYDEASFDQSIDAFNARLHPEDLDRVTRDLQAAIETVGIFESEYRLVLPDASRRWIGARGRTLADESGAAVRVLGAAYDITERRTAEARVTSVLESMATAFFALDPQWRFSYVNAEAERLLGSTREQMLGAVIWDLFPAALGSEFETHYRSAMDTGRPVAFDAYYPAPLDAWYEVRTSRTAEGLAVYFLDVTARRRLQLEAEGTARRADLLSRITDELVGTLDHDEAARRLARLVVPALADWCVVSLVHDDEQAGRRLGLRNIGAHHSDPDLQHVLDGYAQARLTEMVDDTIVVAAVETGTFQRIRTDATREVQALFDPGVARDLIGRLAPESVVVMPLTGPAGPVGMLSLANGPARGDFTDQDMVTATHVGARAGLVLDNARLYRQQRELAEGLQRSMLTAPAESEHVQIAVRYVPAGERAQVGGDWYDAFLQTDSAMIIAVGDVCGHDISAAATMGQLRSLLRGIAVSSGAGPAELLTGVDAAMATLHMHTYATAVVARLEPADDGTGAAATRVLFSNAGHLPPMVISSDAVVTPLVGARPELLLGVQPEASRTETEVTLPAGSTVLLYTDGLVERRQESLDEGLDRLRAALHELSLRGLGLDDLCDELFELMAPGHAEDDIALLAVRLV